MRQVTPLGTERYVIQKDEQYVDTVLSLLMFIKGHGKSSHTFIEGLSY